MPDSSLRSSGQARAGPSLTDDLRARRTARSSRYCRPAERPRGSCLETCAGILGRRVGRVGRSIALCRGRAPLPRHRLEPIVLEAHRVAHPGPMPSSTIRPATLPLAPGGCEVAILLESRLPARHGRPRRAPVDAQRRRSGAGRGTPDNTKSTHVCPAEQGPSGSSAAARAPQASSSAAGASSGVHGKAPAPPARAASRCTSFAAAADQGDREQPPARIRPLSPMSSDRQRAGRRFATPPDRRIGFAGTPADRRRACSAGPSIEAAARADGRWSIKVSGVGERRTGRPRRSASPAPASGSGRASTGTGPTGTAAPTPRHRQAPRGFAQVP